MSGEPLDAEVFDALQDAMGEDFVDDLENYYLVEAPTMLTDLKAAAESGDQDVLRRAAQSLKSNADVFGAKALADRARHVELGGVGDDPAATFAELEALYADAAAALIEWRDG